MKKRSKILASLVLAGTMVLGLAGCGDSGSANGGTQSGKNSGAKYQVGICQLVQHEALDAATKGFKDALKDKLGDDVSFDEQNAAGDASTCLQSAPSSSQTTMTLSLEMPQQLFRPLQQLQTLFLFSEHLSQITLQLLICQTGQTLQERIFRYYRPRSTR